MPFIDTKLNIKLTEDKEKLLKTRLAEAIATFPGKSEYWLMLNFTDESRLWFRGYDSVPAAMVEVKIFGSASDEVANAMTGKICRIFEEVLGIKPDHVYVKYEFCTHWGWNGENF